MARYVGDLTDPDNPLQSPITSAIAFMTGLQLRGEKEDWPKATMTDLQNVIDVLILLAPREA